MAYEKEKQKYHAEELITTNKVCIKKELKEEAVVHNSTTIADDYTPSGAARHRERS